ncbi:hypothetical protein CVIRNUC_006016 [Coccomyxa viridis]|uniref:DUF948 domain-containing protein n=1 Tax=Coccomyxa viridis TaxID=1274662 RepID=A0AAV1I632_9CHLO|nr:hypothetical protein CVIRNUC_006016 [Coccomyxa viridis]
MSIARDVLPKGSLRAVGGRTAAVRGLLRPLQCLGRSTAACASRRRNSDSTQAPRYHPQLEIRQNGRCNRRSPTCPAVPASSVTAAATTNLPGLLIGVGTFLLGLAACVFVIAALPSILATRQTMLEMQSMLRTVDQELPDTAAAVRLSGLELSDAIEEVSLLSNDLTTGVRATAQMMAATRATITESALLANAVVASHVLPAVRSRIPGARSKAEERLRERARLKHTAATVQQVASTAKVAARRTRAALAALDLAAAMRRPLQTARQLRGPKVPLAPQ